MKEAHFNYLEGVRMDYADIINIEVMNVKC